MKRKLSVSILVASLFLWIACDSESSVDLAYKDHFIKYYGEDGNQEGKDLVINNDGTIIILGTSTTTTGSKRMYLAKTDVEGEIIWEKNLGSLTNDEVAQDIEFISAGPEAGNYVVLSNVKKNSNDSLAIRLTVVASNGDSLKSTYFNYLESQEARSITHLTNGAFYVAGKTTDTDPSDAGNATLPINDLEDVLVVRFNNDFTWLVSDVYRVGSSSIGSAIKIFENGTNFSYAGFSDIITPGEDGIPTDYENNFFFRQFTTDPRAPSSTDYAGSSTQQEILASISKSPSGFFLAIGTQFTTGGINRLFATKLNGTTFTKAAEGILNSNDELEGVSVTASGASQFLVVGNKISPGGKDIWLAKVGTTLSVQFSVTFGGANNDDTASAVAELPNGDIVVLGTMNLVNQNKIALIKLKSNGQF